MTHNVYEKQKSGKTMPKKLRLETVLRSFIVILLNFIIDLSCSATLPF